MTIPFVGPGSPGSPKNKLLVPRDPDAAPRTGRALSIIADLLNDLILDGILVMVGPGQWEVHIPTLEGVNPTVARFVANSIIVDGTTGLRVVDDGNLTGTLSLLASGMPPSEITVKEVDGSPTITDVTTIAFDQADGFVVTNPSAGVARIDLSLAYAPGTLATVKGLNDTPITVNNVSEIDFDQAKGGVISSPGAGRALLTLIEATYLHWGVVSTNDQEWTGNKGFADKVSVGFSTAAGDAPGPHWISDGQLTVRSNGVPILVLGKPTGQIVFGDPPLQAWARYGESSSFLIGPQGEFCTTQTQVPQTVGAVIGRMPVYDRTYGLVGYFPIYESGSFNGTTTLTGDVTGSGMGSFAATIANDAVTNAKLANMATQTFKGRTTAGTGDPEDLSVAQAQAMLKAAVPLFDHYADAGNSTTTETDLYSDTLAAGQLAANGDKVEAEYGGTFVSSATATRQVKLYFGGTAIFDTGALTLSLSSAWTLWATFIRKDSGKIRYLISLTTEGAALSAYTAVGELTGLTLANTQGVKITGQAAGVGAASNDIVAILGDLCYRPAA